MIFAVVLLLAVLILLGAGYFFTRVAIYPKVFLFDETYRLDVENGRLVEEIYTPWPKEEIRVRSPYGYDLVGFYHPVAGSKRTVVISHGITWSRYGSVKYGVLFYKRGFNVLIYDLRHHGQSGGPNTSFGYYEKMDLKCVVDWALERLGEGGIVGTAGESLGAATTLEHAGVDPRIRFALADCSFSDLPRLFAYRLRMEYHLPAFPLIPIASWVTRIVAGWSFQQASPLQYLPQIETPIFFVHGKEDSYIPAQMSVEMYEAKRKGYRKLYLAPNAGHAEALLKNPAEYDHEVGVFLKEIGL